MVTMLLFGANRAEQAGVESAVATAYARLGYVAGIARIDLAADAYFRRADAALAWADRPVDRGVSLYLRAFHHLGSGDWDRVEALAREASRLLEAIGDRQEAEIAQTIGAHALYYRGAGEEALACYRAIVDSARGRANAQHLAWGLCLSARSHLALGRVEEAVACMAEARVHVAQISDRMSAALCDGLLAEVLVRAGRVEEAARVARLLMPRLKGPPLPLAPCLHAYAGVTEALIAAWEEGDRRARAEVPPALSKLAAFAGVFPIAVPAALRALGRAARAAGWARPAAALLHASATSARARRMPYDEAAAWRDAGAPPR
jgi:tetratricopeptide (TPR) repeat protein